MAPQTSLLRHSNTSLKETELPLDSGVLREALREHRYLEQVVVVDGVGDLPLNVQRHLVREGLDLSEVKGVFSAGRSYVVAGNLLDVEEGIKTALHEVVGHEGVRALLGERFEPVMRQLYESFPREHEVWQTTERRYGYLDTGTQAGRIAFAEELTAYMAETAPEMGEFAMIKAEIRAQLREQFPALPMEEWEVHALIQRSRESLILRHGEPAEIEELKAKLSYREGAVKALQAYDQEQGRGGPDPLSLALYQRGSQVFDTDGLPTRLYHGAGRDVSQINGTFWGSTDPTLANQYAEMRSDMGWQASVVPYYADIRRPFDGDPLAAVKSTPETPSALTVGVFVEELIRQSDVDDSLAESLREQGRTLRVYGRIEESGPSYSPQDFWYQTNMAFGREGAALLQKMFAAAGFDGIRYTEQGSVSYGAFSPAQLHFIDQGATLRGWQPDRGHGLGTDSQAAFNRWFGQSHAVDAAGKPLRLFHGTTSDFSTFHTGRGAIYTTPDTEIASIYARAAEAEIDEGDDEVGPNIMLLYLSLQNPLVLDEAWAVENLDQDGEREWTILDEVLYQAEQEGYDGAILRGMDDQYIAFRPEQVKSALTNVGSFDPTNPDIRYAIHAYHGSPHKFSRFDLSKVNSGEGNQTFGHGLYFASMEAVASAYLYAGKGTRMQLDGRSLLSRENTQAAKADPLLNRAVGYLAITRDAQLAVEMAVADERPEVAHRMLELLREGRITKVTPGNLYEVVLSPNESDLLDWDAPIEEQSPTVLARLREAGVSLEPNRETLTGKFTGKDLYQALVMRADEETFDRQGPLWDVVKDDPNRLTYSMDAIASRYLNAIGVPGLRYYDGDSRVAGGGSHNYVMFDDKLIEITDVRYKLDADASGAALDGPADEVVTISAFQRWFGDSAVVDGDGKPLVVFHGTEKGGFTAFDTDGSGRTAGTGAFFTKTRLGASDYAGTEDDAVMIDRDELLAHPERYDVTIEVHGSDEDGWEYLAHTDEHDGAGKTREEALEALADSLESAEVPGVYPVYLSLQNPMIVDCHHSNWDEIVTHWDIVDEGGETIDFIHDPAEIEPYLEANPHHTVEDGVSRNSNDLAREAREMGFDGLIMLNVSDEGPHGQGYAWDDVIYVAFKPEQVKSIYNVGSYDPANEDIRYSLSPRASRATAEVPASSKQSAFESWFAASVVTDPQGQPLSVYHGSPDIRGIIQQGFQRSPTRGEVYFSDDYQVADTYADDSRAWDYQNAEPYTAPFYLSLQNPYVIDGAGQKWRETQRHIAEARALGHDGIIIRNSRDEYNHTGNGGKPSTVYAVFDPEQIGAAEPKQPLYSRIDRQPLGDLSVLDRAAPGRPTAAPRLSFAGESAITMNALSLHNAQQAEAAGVDREVVRQATGWFRGAEGRWRFEIDDSQAALKPQLAMLGHGRRGIIDMHKVEHKALGDGRYHVSLTPVDASLPSDIVQIVNVDREALEQLLPVEVVSGIVEGRGEDIWGGQMPEAGLSFEYRFTYRPLQALALSEVLEHPALFQAYPVLNDVLVKVDPALGREARFGFEAAGGPGRPFVITLGKHQQLSSLLHELQHCVQAIEGFAPGGSANDKTLPRQSDIVDRLTRETQERISAITASPDYKAYLEREFEAAGKVVSRRTGQPVQARAGDIRQAADERFGVTALRAELKERLSTLQSEGAFLNERYTAYRCLAGEVEARNVESRLAMRAEERQAISPTQTQDVATRDQLVRSPLESERAVAGFKKPMPSGAMPSAHVPRYSFAGESARTAPRLQLAHAQRAIQTGIDPEVVRQETGWHQGVEGRWRFEISDHEAKVRYGESTSSNPAAYIDWVDEAEHRERGVRLSTVLDHPALFEAYPQLAAYRVKVESPAAMGKASGGFDEEARTIKLVDPYSLPADALGKNTVLNILLHELQHAVQAIEGFALGGNVEKIRRDAGAMAMTLPNRKVVEDAEFILAQRERAGFDSIDDFVAYVPCANFDQWQDTSIAMAKDPERLADCRRRLDAYDDAPGEYRRLAGEVEARNVEKRQAFSPKERLQTPPSESADVPPSHQKVVISPSSRDIAARHPTLTPLQSLNASEGVVVNHTTVGTQLQEAAESMLDILDAHGLPVGWSDGGCRILAEALVEWSEGQLQLGVTCNHAGKPSHAVAILSPGGGTNTTGMVILDGEGIAREEELYRRLHQLENSPAEHLAAVGAGADTLATALPMDDAALSYAVRGLAMHLGEYSQWSRQLCQEIGAIPETQMPVQTTTPAINVASPGVG